MENVSEAVARIMRKHNVPVAMKPYKTLKTVLVHPKDKQEKEDLTECVYKVPCWVRFGKLQDRASALDGLIAACPAWKTRERRGWGSVSFSFVAVFQLANLTYFTG